MKTDGKKIDALIFDLGGVLIDLDLEKCKKAFAERLSYNGIDMLLDAFHQKGIYSDLEEGLISADEFRSRILAASAPGCTAGDVDEAVFALLVGVRPYKFALLTGLAKSYDLYLLSNTNPISMIKCYRLFEEAGYPLDRMFRKLFLSYQMKMQKPSERVCQRNGLEEVERSSIANRHRYGNMSFVVARWTSLRPITVGRSFRRFLRPVGACHRRLHESWTASPPLHCGGNEGVSK